jgi:hypothetical protein
MTRTRPELPLPDTIVAWQCIGCGRLEAPQNCVGICQDRKVEIVNARDYAEARFALDEANERIAALEALVDKLSRVTPREGAWKQCYLALQAHARKLVAHEAAVAESTTAV